MLDEVIAEDIGLELHVTRYLKPKLYSDRYAGHSLCCSRRPLGVAKGNFLEENSFDVLQRLGIPAFPASTNNIDPRILAVETLLLQQRDGGPALVIDEDRCPTLIRALGGDYRYSQDPGRHHQAAARQDPSGSDVADALQYVCLAMNSGLVNFIAKRIRPREKRRPQVPRERAGWT